MKIAGGPSGRLMFVGCSVLLIICGCFGRCVFDGSTRLMNAKMPHAIKMMAIDD